MPLPWGQQLDAVGTADPSPETRFVGFCYPNGGLVAAQVIERRGDDSWEGVGLHLSSNQDYAYYDARRIASDHGATPNTYEWAGLFATQAEMDAFQEKHPPHPTRGNPL